MHVHGIDFYLVFGKNPGGYAGKELSVRLSKTEPKLEKNEIKLKVHAVLPFSLFEESVLKAHLVIPENKTQNVDVDIVNSLKGVAKDVFGLQLEISSGKG